MSDQLDFAALEDCLKTLNYLYIDINRLEAEAGYEAKRGGYGDVQVSRLDSGTAGSKLVAAKRIYLKARHKQPERLAFRLARELKVWARLHHPHVLPVLGYYLDKEYRLAVLMSEYMIHGDLKDYIEEEKPSWDVRLYLVRDTTAGLAYLHGQDPPICHGDLKTGNVLINVERRAVLADFGLSRTLEDGPTGLTTSDGLKGTLRYYSPEIVAETAGCHSLPSDIWAWACLVLEVLADIIPYAGKKSEHSIIKALMNKEPPSDTISLPIPVPAVKHLLARCWTVQPNDRPSVDHCLAVIATELPTLQMTPGVGRDSYQGSNLQSSNFDEDHSSNRLHEDGGWPPAMGSQAGPNPTAIQNRPGMTQGPQGPPQSNGMGGAAFLEQFVNLPVEAYRNHLVNIKTKINALEEQRDRFLQIKTPQRIEQAQRVQAQMNALQNLMQQLTEAYARDQAMGLQRAVAGGPSGQRVGQPQASGQGGPMAGGLPNLPLLPPQLRQFFNNPEVMKLSPEELKRRGLSDDIIQTVMVYRQAALLAKTIQNRREQENLLQQRQIQAQQAQQAAAQAASLLNPKKETPQMAPGDRPPSGLGGAQPPGLGPAVGHSLQPSALPSQPGAPQLPATLAGLNVSPEQLAKAQEKVRAAIKLLQNKHGYWSIMLSHEQGTLLEQSIQQTQSLLKQVVQNLVAFVVLAPNDERELIQVAQTVVTLSDQNHILQKKPLEKRFIFGRGDLNQYRNQLTRFLMRVKGLQSQAMALQSQQASGALPPGPPPPKPSAINSKFALGEKPVPKHKLTPKRGATKPTSNIPPAEVRGISRPEPERPQSSKREREDDVTGPDGSAGPYGPPKRVRTDPQEDLDTKSVAYLAAGKQVTIEGSLDFLEKMAKEDENFAPGVQPEGEGDDWLWAIDSTQWATEEAAAPVPSQAPFLNPEEEGDDWLWAIDSTQRANEDLAVGETQG